MTQEFSWVRYISGARTSPGWSRRRTAALALELDWGPLEQVFEVDANTFENRALALFGYPGNHPSLRPLRDLFCHCERALLYRLGRGGKAAACPMAKAKCQGSRGNSLRISVNRNPADTRYFFVITTLARLTVDIQRVASAEDLLDNDFVLWNRDFHLKPVRRMALAGGEDVAVSDGADYGAFLDTIEAYSFVVLGCLSPRPSVVRRFIRFTRWMRQREGALFQTVVYRDAPGYEGIISLHTKAGGNNPAALVAWVTGLAAACRPGESCQGTRYDGETPVKLKGNAVPPHRLALYPRGQGFVVGEDRNSLEAIENEPPALSDNAAMRLADGIANDLGVLFYREFMGQVPREGRDLEKLRDCLTRYFEGLVEDGVLSRLSPRTLHISGWGDGEYLVVTLQVSRQGEAAFPITFIID